MCPSELVSLMVVDEEDAASLVFERLVQTAGPLSDEFDCAIQEVTDGVVDLDDLDDEGSVGVRRLCPQLFVSMLCHGFDELAATDLIVEALFDQTGSW